MRNTEQIVLDNQLTSHHYSKVQWSSQYGPGTGTPGATERDAPSIHAKVARFTPRSPWILGTFLLLASAALIIGLAVHFHANKARTR